MDDRSKLSSSKDIEEFKSSDSNGSMYNSVISQDAEDNRSSYENFDSDIGSKNNDEEEVEDQTSKPLLSKKKLVLQVGSGGASKSDQIELKNLRKPTTTKTERLESEMGDEAERESLLVQDTNLDSIQPVETLEAEEPNVTTSFIINSNQDQDVNRFNARGIIDRVMQNTYVRMFKPKWIKLVYLIVLGMVLFVCIVLPSCIFSLEYNKIALARNSWTGSVDDRYVYGSGIHFMLPWNEWILFDKTAQSLSINNLHIFTTDKLQVNATFKIFYFLDKTNLNKFYRKHGTEYAPLLYSVCKSELMNEGSKFSIVDYRTKRLHVRTILKERIAKKLQDFYYVKMFDLYMDKLEFLKEINDLNLLVMLNGIYNEKEVAVKKEKVVVAETNNLVNSIKNEASLVLKTAELEANFTKIKIEEINLEQKLEFTYLKVIDKSLKELKFKQPSQAISRNESQRILSFCYLSSLTNTNTTVNYYSPNKYPSQMPGQRQSLAGLAGLVSLN